MRGMRDSDGRRPFELPRVQDDARLSTLLEPSVPLTLALLAEIAAHRDVRAHITIRVSVLSRLEWLVHSAAPRDVLTNEKKIVSHDALDLMTLSQSSILCHLNERGGYFTQLPYFKP